MFINDLSVNVGYESWTLRVAPIEPYAAPTVVITDANGRVHFTGSEQEAFTELVRIIAREHQAHLNLPDKALDTISPSEKTVTSSSSKQGGKHARPQSSP